VTQAVTDEPQPAALAVAAQQDLGNGQADQLSVRQPGRPARPRPLAQQLIDGDVQCDHEVVEDGAHEASLEVGVVVATPILGGLVTTVTARPSHPHSASFI
jgi:hypothetical protein